MIQLAEDVEYLESRKVPLDPMASRVLIEFASNRRIDVAVVDTEKLKEFDDSEAGDDVKGIEWYEKERARDFEFKIPDGKKYYLLFWNANDEKPAIIAYRVTPLEQKKFTLRGYLATLRG